MNGGGIEGELGIYVIKVVGTAPNFYTDYRQMPLRSAKPLLVVEGLYK